MSVHVSLKVLNELRKMRVLSSILCLFVFAMSLINSIIQEHECSILFI